jgi:hypothetical protein
MTDLGFEGFLRNSGCSLAFLIASVTRLPAPVNPGTLARQELALLAK